MHTDLVYDIGMHNGDDTAYYLHRGYRVVAVEADASLVEQARRRFVDEIAQGRLTLLNVAIADHEGTARFFVCDDAREWNSLNDSWASRAQSARAVEVACTRLAMILREHGVPHYLKIDIEGCENYCLDDLHPDGLPTFLSVELSDLQTLIRIYGLGYDGFKCVDQASKRSLPFPPARTTLKQTVKRRLANYPRVRELLRRARRASGRASGRARAQATAHEVHAPSAPAPPGHGWRFSLHSSGPFGDDIGGPWLDVEQAAAVWASEWSRRGYPPPGLARRDLWIDLHATRRAVA
jgi:FkbM family methyltransferase